MDLWHEWGAGLKVSATGDLAVVDGSEMTRQRILRRLMTAIKGYVWHKDYGAGVPQMIGSPQDTDDVTALIRSQIMLERAVGRNPLPEITVTRIPGGMDFSILFWNADVNAQDLLQFTYTL
jgi:hypothetical protein